MEHGYAGKILKIDLSSGNTSYLPTAHYAGRFIGGRGIAAGIYWDDVPPDIKAFDAANPLIFMTGPLAGFTGLAGSRLQICGKSPATTPEMFCYANLGGSWGAGLKFSGHDGVVVRGRSDMPVYIYIDNGTVEIRDAAHIWNKSSIETRKILKAELGSSARVLAAGIAGENLVPFATVLADEDAAGASGFAAVMGSKKLKAVVVRGDEAVVPARPEELKEIAGYLRRLTRGRLITPSTIKGPPFPLKKKRQACFGCIHGCLRAVFEASNGDRGKLMCQQSAVYIEAAMKYHGEWTEVPFMASRLCDSYGLDTMVVEPLIKWLYRCGQAGILTDGNTGIPISKYGSLEFIESVVRKISLREGFGDVLAKGVMAAARDVGSGAGELIGDLVFPRTGEEWVYDPRMFLVNGIFYAMEPKRPIQHLHEVSWLVAQWLAWRNGAENSYVSADVVRRVAGRFWGSEAAGDFSTSEGKALAARKIQDRQYVKECLILCDYAWPVAHVRYSEDHLGDPAVEARVFSAVTGRETDENGLYKTGERVFNLQRAILAREGRRGKEADTIPEFNYAIPLQHTEHNPDCLLPGKGGEAVTRKGAVVDRAEFEKMRDEYYSLRGWDVATGLQTEATLRELDLPDVAADLARRGLAV